MFRTSVGSKLFHRLKTLGLRGIFRKKHEQLKYKLTFPACDNLPPKRPKYKFLTMDDMLVPSGNWKDHYTKRNQHYNRVFLFGFISLIGSILTLKETIFFNAFPPPYPFEKHDDDESECEHENLNECDCDC